MADDFSGIGLRAFRSCEGCVYTERVVEIEETGTVKVYADERVGYYGSEEKGRVERRWAVRSVAKESGLYIGSRNTTDEGLRKMFPEQDLNLPEKPDDCGKSYGELLIAEMEVCSDV